MVPTESMLEALAQAGVAAIRCELTRHGITICERTPEYFRAMHSLSGRLDERALVTRLEQAWPNPDQPRLFPLPGISPHWRCVVRVLDSECVMILQSTAEVPTHHDTFYSIVENLPDVVTRHDRQYRYVYVNPAFEATTGVSADARLGKDHREVGVDEQLVTIFQSIYQQAFDTGRVHTAEFSYAGQAGLRHYTGRAVPEFDRNGQAQTILAIVRDITELKQLQQQLKLLAETDPLTSLANRRGFIRSLEEALTSRHADGSALSLLLLDVDNFKYINDRFGHPVGDQVLQEIGRALLEQTGPGDIAARWGGDEFCVALIGVDEPGAQLFAQRIHRHINDISVASFNGFSVDVSVGVAAATPTDDSAAALIARVDALMYHVKRRRL
jgi:diguanylate cyclase (GGDEF)-like protein/PAS domain S-box-containing protein